MDPVATAREAVHELDAHVATTARWGLRDPDLGVRPNARIVWEGDRALRFGGALIDAAMLRWPAIEHDVRRIEMAIGWIR